MASAVPSPAPSAPPLYFITGIMASGKSTVAQALAERFERSVHVRGDGFRRAIVSGRVDMSPDPSPEALAQLRLRYELAVMCAERYHRAGFVTVVQDIAIGPILDDVIAMFEARPLAVVVLAPSAEAVTAREAARAKTGYVGFTPEALDEILRDRTTRHGLWLDTSALTVTETVAVILARTDEALV